MNAEVEVCRSCGPMIHDTATGERVIASPRVVVLYLRDGKQFAMIHRTSCDDVPPAALRGAARPASEVFGS